MPARGRLVLRIRMLFLMATFAAAIFCLPMASVGKADTQSRRLEARRVLFENNFHIITPILQIMVAEDIMRDASGMIFETPADDALLKEVADFMWNFGRQPITSFN
jgi:hypothetical protein